LASSSLYLCYLIILWYLSGEHAFPWMVFTITLASAWIGLALKSEIETETLHIAVIFPMMAVIPDTWLYDHFSRESELAHAAVLALLLSQAAAVLAALLSGLRGLIKAAKEDPAPEDSDGSEPEDVDDKMDPEVEALIASVEREAEGHPAVLGPAAARPLARPGICRQCQAENEPDAKFCVSCGAKL
jgi:hypothetical protein